MKKKNITIDDLAGMVAKGFEGVNSRIDKLDTRLGNVEIGQEEIKLKLDNVAYRFELRELERRIELLEKKAKFA